MPLKFQKLSWKTACNLVKKSPAAAGAKALLAAADKVAVVLDSKAFVYLASYSFAESIVTSDGFTLAPLDVDEVPLEGLTNKTPVNIVLNNQVEVFLPGKYLCVDRSESWGKGYHIDRPTSLRVLGPGELFGTFEAVARILGMNQPSTKPWEVCAGLRTAQLIYPLRSKPVRMQLSRLLGSRFEADKGGPFPGWPWHIMAKLAHQSSWQVQTIVFPHHWEDKKLPWEWRQQVFASAWTQMQDDKVNEIRREEIGSHVNDDMPGISSDIRERDLFTAFLRTVDAAVAGRLPVFVPYTMSSHGYEGGPFVDIVKTFVANVAESHINRNASQSSPSWPLVLVPHYLSADGPGLMSFHHTTWLRECMGLVKARTKDACIIARLIQTHIGECKAFFPAVDWDEIRVALRFNSGPTPSGCIKTQDLSTEFEKKFPTPTAYHEVSNKRVDTTHSFFSPSVLVKRKGTK